MRFPVIGRIAQKEILTTIRDRRAIISNLLLPLLLLPVIMLGLPLVLGGLFNREEAQDTALAVQNMSQMPARLAQHLESANVEPYESDDPQAQVRGDEAPVGLVIPADMEARIVQGEPVELQLYSKLGNLSAEVASGKVNGAVGAYRQEIVAERLGEAGLDPAVLEPVSVQSLDASSDAERASGQFSWIIPFFIAIWTLVGGQMTAIDATAGEKERGTLESLLVAPVRRSEVVIGKFLATLLFGLAAAVMAIVGYVAGSSILGGFVASRIEGGGAEIVSAMGGSLQVSPAAVGMLLMSTLLLSATLAALLLGITMFARSFKEAQSYVAPLSFLLILPVMALQFQDLLDLGNWIYLVPVLNVLLMMNEVVKGSVETAPVIMTWGSLAVTIFLLLAFALRNFMREDVIFRT